MKSHSYIKKRSDFIRHYELNPGRSAKLETVFSGQGFFYTMFINVGVSNGTAVVIDLL